METKILLHSIINLLAYKYPEQSKQEVYLVSDGQPISRLEICNAASQNEFYRGASIPTFLGGEKVDGKIYNTSKIKSRLEDQIQLCIYFCQKSKSLYHSKITI